MMKIFLNSEIVDVDQAKISVLDRGYLFGEALFETFRVYEGTIPFLDRHLERLEWSSSFVGVNFPHPADIERGIREIIKINKLKNARVKVIISSQGETSRPIQSQDHHKTNLVIISEEFTPLEPDLYENGVHLGVVHSVKCEGAPVANLKSTSWLPKILATREIEEKSVFDGILLNNSGFVTETTKSNIFWVKNEVVYTSPIETGVLPGITRGIAIELIKDEGYEFKENMIKLEDLLKVDEVFLTGSSLEVMPVTSIAESNFSSSKKGSISHKIREAYQERLKEEIEDERDE